jgi:hypothetical protein
MNLRNGIYPKIKVIMYSGRLIVRCNKKMFYRSTGRNSMFKDTWFPCVGIQRRIYKSKRGLRRKGWIKKPKGCEVLKYFRNCKLYREIDRFGTLKDMLISCMIGGGFWDDGRSVVIKDELIKMNINVDEELKMIYYALDCERGLVDLDVDAALRML